ncbi:hypothetical protein IAT38_008339 [Cryptococcus sp. DSM 104549]
MRYSYTFLDDFFTLSTWEEDMKGPFGLRSPPGDWAAFTARIEELKAQCAEGESIKVIYAARHGQAEHNLLQDRPDIPEEIMQSLYHIHDAELTDLGRQQASELGKALQREVEQGMPVPEKFFVSPLKRTGETCGLEWGWLFGDKKDKGHGVAAVVIENIRESLHLWTCNKRSPLQDLKALFPSFTYPEGTTESDELWQPKSGATYISVTSHSGILRGIYTALTVPPRRLVVGEMNVLVLKVKEVADE